MNIAYKYSDVNDSIRQESISLNKVSAYMHADCKHIQSLQKLPSHY